MRRKLRTPPRSAAFARPTSFVAAVRRHRSALARLEPSGPRPRLRSMASPGDHDVVAERLSTAAARLKALQAQALEVSSFDDVAPPSRADAALARLHAATADLDPLRAELAMLRSRLDEVASELRSR